MEKPQVPTPARTSTHWRVLAWLVAGALVGLALQVTLAGPAWIGASFEAGEGGLRVTALEAGSPAAKAGFTKGSTWRLAVLRRMAEDRGPEDQIVLDSKESLAAVLARAGNGEVIWFFPARADKSQPALPFAEDEEGARSVTAAIEPGSALDGAIYPFALVAEVFLALLKMLIVPLVLASIVSGVAGVGVMKDLRRLGKKTLVYYLATSLLAILLGQLLVTVFQPGRGARLGLPWQEPSTGGQDGLREFIEVVKRMVPSNVFQSLQDNGAMLAIIFFALVLGYSITKTAEPHKTRMREFFDAAQETMMAMAKSVLSLLPYGVFALMVKVVAGTGLAPFKSLLFYMVLVAAGLLIHCAVVLPLVLRFVARISPRAWARAMSPALFTAFSTSSSSMTLPVTMECVEQRGRVSPRVTSFTLPLGATVNMDGTALYECMGVIFLAQYYASVGGEALSLFQQGYVVLLALLASIGAAGIPSAGLVMMLTILSALHLPVEGAALLLAIDRPLDMLRTVTNVWSDTCGAAVVARSEGETLLLSPARGN